MELLPPGLSDPETRLNTLLLFGAGLAMVPLMRRLLESALPSMGAAQGAALLVMRARCRSPRRWSRCPRG